MQPPPYLQVTQKTFRLTLLPQKNLPQPQIQNRPKSSFVFLEDPPIINTIPNRSQPKESQVYSLTSNDLNQVRSKIEASLHYPRSLMRRAIQGKVIVRLILDPRGQILSKDIIKSSGFEELDFLALQAIDQAAPFDTLSSNPGSSQIEMGKFILNLPIDFRIR